jgi:hypothetical protein
VALCTEVQHLLRFREARKVIHASTKSTCSSAHVSACMHCKFAACDACTVASDARYAGCYALATSDASTVGWVAHHSILVMCHGSISFAPGEPVATLQYAHFCGKGILQKENSWVFICPRIACLGTAVGADEWGCPRQLSIRQ